MTTAYTDRSLVQLTFGDCTAYTDNALVRLTFCDCGAKNNTNFL